jgi:Gram-negative bacterial TonB protein C-terminal
MNAHGSPSSSMALVGFCFIGLALSAPAQDASIAAPTPGHVVTAVSPSYPEVAIAARVEATIIADVEVGSDGVPISVIQEPRFGLLAAAVQEAAMSWRFAPTGVPCRAHLTFSFRVGLEAGRRPTDRDVTAAFTPPYAVQILARTGPYQFGDPSVSRKRKPWWKIW